MRLFALSVFKRAWSANEHKLREKLRLVKACRVSPTISLPSNFSSDKTASAAYPPPRRAWCRTRCAWCHMRCAVCVMCGAASGVYGAARDVCGDVCGTMCGVCGDARGLGAMRGV